MTRNNDEFDPSDERRSGTDGGKCRCQGRMLNCIKRRGSVQEGHMELLIMLTRVFIHIIGNFNRGFAGAALDESKLVWVKQGMLVKEEGKPSGHCSGGQFGDGFQQGDGAEQFRVFGEGSHHS